MVSGCTPAAISHVTPVTGPIDPGPEARFSALSALKEELKQQLAEVEKQHAEASASLLPQTVEQVDELTKKLQDALEELKSRRAELAKKAKPAEKK